MEKSSNIGGVVLTPIDIIRLKNGDVFQCMKKNEPGYAGFGEVYCSFIKSLHVKGWKKHKKMTLNLIVPTGTIRFVIFDDRKGSTTFGHYQDVKLSRKNYLRLTIPPMLWMAFQGLGSKENMLLNIANIPHDSSEATNRSLQEIHYNWSI